MRERMCKSWEPGRALSIFRGKLCIRSHPRHRLFIKQQYKNSAGQPFSAAEAAFSLTSQAYCGPRLKSMPRPRPTADTLFHQYVYFGLDPTPPASTTRFFFHSRTVLFFSLLLHLQPVFAEVQRELTQRFQMKREDLHSLFPRESSFPCPALSSSVFLLFLSSSCPQCPLITHFVLAICIQFSPHPSTYLNFLLLSLL